MWLAGEKQRLRLKWILRKFCLWAFPNANTYLYNLTHISCMKKFSVCYQLTGKSFHVSPKWLRNPSAGLGSVGSQELKVVVNDLYTSHHETTGSLNTVVLQISYRPVTCGLHSQQVEGVFPVRTQTIVPNNYFTPLTALIKGWRPFHSLNVLYLIFLFQSQVPSQAVYHSFKISLLIWIYIPITSGSFHQLKLAAVASLFISIFLIYQQGYYHKKLLLIPRSSSWIQIPESAHTNH